MSTVMANVEQRSEDGHLLEGYSGTDRAGSAADTAKARAWRDGGAEPIAAAPIVMWRRASAILRPGW